MKSALFANGYPEWIFRIPTKEAKPPASSSKGEPLNQCVFTLRERNIVNFTANLQILSQALQLTTAASHPCKRPYIQAKKCGVVYHIQCEQCQENYIGETARTLGVRVKKHQSRETSAVFEHCRATGHNISPYDIKVLTTEDHTIKRHVKEAISIKQRKPSLNRARDTGPPGRL